MANIPFYNINLSECTVTQLDDMQQIFFSKNIIPKIHVISEVIRWQRAKKRSGCQSALTKGEVSGTGKKPFPQKGRGVARQGTLKNPHQRGGGVAFAPKPRSYEYKISKNKRKIALQSILLIRLKEKNIKIVKKIILEKPSTKIIYTIIKKMNLRKTLLIDDDNINLKLSLRNTKDIKFLNVKGLNTIDMLMFPSIVITEAALNIIIKKFS